MVRHGFCPQLQYKLLRRNGRTYLSCWCSRGSHLPGVGKEPMAPLERNHKGWVFLGSGTIKCRHFESRMHVVRVSPWQRLQRSCQIRVSVNVPVATFNWWEQLILLCVWLLGFHVSWEPTTGHATTGMAPCHLQFCKERHEEVQPGPTQMAKKTELCLRHSQTPLPPRIV